MSHFKNNYSKINTFLKTSSNYSFFNFKNQHWIPHRLNKKEKRKKKQSKNCGSSITLLEGRKE